MINDSLYDLTANPRFSAAVYRKVLLRFCILYANENQNTYPGFIEFMKWVTKYFPTKVDRQ